jgi:hypothetical protein
MAVGRWMLSVWRYVNVREERKKKQSRRGARVLIPTKPQHAASAALSLSPPNSAPSVPRELSASFLLRRSAATPQAAAERGPPERPKSKRPLPPCSTHRVLFSRWIRLSLPMPVRIDTKLGGLWGFRLQFQPFAGEQQQQHARRFLLPLRPWRGLNYRFKQ